MVRMSVELLAEAHQYINTVKERELNLRNFKIPVIENMGVTQVNNIFYLKRANLFHLSFKFTYQFLSPSGKLSI